MLDYWVPAGGLNPTSLMWSQRTLASAIEAALSAVSPDLDQIILVNILLQDFITLRDRACNTQGPSCLSEELDIPGEEPDRPQGVSMEEPSSSKECVSFGILARGIYPRADFAETHDP